MSHPHSLPREQQSPLQGASSSTPPRGSGLYQDQQDAEDISNNSLHLKEDDELVMFNSTAHLNLPAQSFQYLPTQMDQYNMDLIGPPPSRDDFAYTGNNNNDVLQYNQKYDLQDPRFGPTTIGSSSASYYDSQPLASQSYNVGTYPQQQHIQGTQDRYQTGLYPAMMMAPMLLEQDIPVGLNSSTSSIPQSYSMTTISSVDSIPHAYLSVAHSGQMPMPSSQSDNTLPSSIPSQNPAITPRRPAQRRQSVNTNDDYFDDNSGSANVNTPQPVRHQTPKQSIKRTPSARIVKSHRRTRSRMSVDATGLSLLSLQPQANTRSPQTAGGTNPFYTPSINQYSRHDSPEATPLATPLSKRKDQSFVSISPMMLMNQHRDSSVTPEPNEPPFPSDVFAEAADMTLKMASRFASSVIPTYQSPQKHQLQQEQQQYHQQQHLAKQYLKQEETPRYRHRQTASMSGLSFSPFPTSNHFLVDPSNSEVTTNSPDTSQQSISTSSSTPTALTQIIHNKHLSMSETSKSSLSKSQSAFNLASLSQTNSKLIPPEITKYDILTPRKQQSRLKKSQSTTDVPISSMESTTDHLNNVIGLTSTGKRQRKTHLCPLCNAVFQRPEHVKRHMRSHSSEKPFICEEPDCGKRFNRGDNMKAHLRKIHGRTDV